MKPITAIIKSKNMKYQMIMDSPLGKLLLMEEDGALVKLSFRAEYREAQIRETPVLLEAKRQLEEYFKGERKVFDLPLNYEGTPFQHEVWDALRKIPYGEVRSYKEIAEAIKRPKAFRAVGQAVHNNPIALIVPCHRVIASDGSLGGFAAGPETKMKILTLENVIL